jgi:signal transduction histidine kinase
VTRLVDDLLDASRISSKRFEINPRPLRPVAVLEQTLESLMPTLDGRTLSFHADAAARLQWIQADEARLVQVFNNLLGNAIKFTATTASWKCRRWRARTRSSSCSATTAPA